MILNIVKNMEKKIDSLVGRVERLELKENQNWAEIKNYEPQILGSYSRNSEREHTPNYYKSC